MSWPEVRLSRVVVGIKDGTHGTFERVAADGMPLLSAKNVRTNFLEVGEGESHISYEDHRSIIANGFPRNGDILLTIVGTIGRSVVFREPRPMAFQRSVCFVRPSSRIDAEFLNYAFQSGRFQDELRLRSKTSAQPGVYMGDVVDCPVPFPPLDKQRQVVDFLDGETAQIDDLIGKQERLIELLAEKRQAVITHAVTRGLNPDAPNKHSGIPWLGDIPQTWRVAELKRALTFITSGSRGWAEFYADHGRPFVRIGNLTRGHLHLDMTEIQYVEIPQNAEGTRAVVEVGDVLFSITAYLGSVAVASEKESGSYVSQHVAITRLDQNRLHPRFLAYFVLSEFGQRQLNEGAYGGTKLQLSLEDIKKLVIPVPGMSEQIEISRHLDANTARIDALIGLSRKSISLLRERRSALISAAVKGKIDVRKEAS